MARKDVETKLSELDKKVLARYKTLTEDDVKCLVVDDKWMTVVEASIKSEMDRVRQTLTHRIKELVVRYEMPMPELSREVFELENKVNKHLVKWAFHGTN